ncbi:hypothetical protein BHE74_00032438 [Ensete ventricosum]|nr:hypothetical protein BHE74_00032438 [Ensete ventricosum]RZS09197.1 hypothetical protein BHM03_00040250 [Ensete ventricosum]
MYVHKPKDTDKHEHFIKHLVCILTVTARGEKSPAGGEGARATRGQREHAGRYFFFFLFPFYSSIDR